MNLKRALRLPDATRLALVGAGGKTSALFQLARQFKPPVLLTATTHLAISQVGKADRWVIANDPSAVFELGQQVNDQVWVITGPPDGTGRLRGVEPAVLEAIHSLAERLGCPLLLEADGSRRLPLKAPAEHEPAIPSFCEQVVVVAGLSGIRKPLTAEWVHRVERYAELSGLALGETINPQAVARVLLHSEGGLKHVPAGARRIVLLNQADTPELQSQGGELSRMLLDGYDSVVVAALELPDEGQKGGGERAEPAGVHAVYERIGAVILAAGGASRFGEPKLLLPWKGEAIIRHVVNTARDAGLVPIVLVAGDQFTELGALTADMGVQVVHNPLWQSGQSSSLQSGLRALPESLGGAVFFLGDMPQTPAGLVRSLVEAHASSLAAIVAPLVDGQRGNPVLFDCDVFPELMELSGDVGGRPLFSRHPVEWVPWHNSNILADVDTREDYWRLKNA